jgi:hypothetical protein
MGSHTPAVTHRETLRRPMAINDLRMIRRGASTNYFSSVEFF